MRWKFLIPLIIFGISISSCKKEELNYGNASTNPINCNCGIIISDNGPYNVSVNNNCTGNVQSFNLSPNDWYSAYVGDNICFSNTSNW